MEAKYPALYLAIDNVFASKRYTAPEEWMKVIKDLGVTYVETSADTECDPLYMGRDYMRRWTDEVGNASAKTGVTVCNLYTGHGTYSTLGLAHTDRSVRRRFLNEWLKPMIETAASLNAGLGFFFHAFPNKVLQDPGLYNEYYSDLILNLAEVAGFAGEAGCRSVSLEQMYTPHQVPWTIKGTQDLLKKVNEKSSGPLYITIDTGHQSGQHQFLKPTRKQLMDIAAMRSSVDLPRIWLGPDSAYRLMTASDQQGAGLTADLILAEIEKYPYLFAEEEDSSPYSWIANLACFSPIIHLQQTDGKSSLHWPFTKTYNSNGIITGEEVIRAIKASFSTKNTDNRLEIRIPTVDKIYLTIEVFSSTSSINYYTLKDLAETVSYWRRFIPEDGMRLR